MMIKYCSECLLPSTKPHLFFQDGICNACINYKNRIEVNYADRQKEFKKIVNQLKDMNTSGWDCVVPVSGGKDSTYQVIKILEFGLKPLCVTSSTCDLSEIGRANLENLKSLGVDLIEFSPNIKVRRKLNRAGLRIVGDIAWPEHVGIFTIPVNIALKFQISAIFWGENSQNEYGGPESAINSNKLDRRWLEEFGGLIGLRVEDLIGTEEITREDLVPYFYPDENLLTERNITGYFLGHYFPWDGLNNYLLSQAFGFKSFGQPVEGSMVDYENLDNFQHGIHDYFKFLKYGYGRATDQVSIHIRRKRITREDGLRIIEKHEGKFPKRYLGKKIEDILSEIDITLEEFHNLCEKFTNKKLFQQNKDGSLKRDSYGNLIKNDYEN